MLVCHPLLLMVFSYPPAATAAAAAAAAAVAAAAATAVARPELVDNTHFEKSLRLVISFGSLKRSQFVNALEERLKPALAKVCVCVWGGGGWL